MRMKPARGSSPHVSRREFARRVALATAAGIVPSAPVVGKANEPQADPSLAKLAPESRARFESMWEHVQRQHGGRLTGEQLTRMRKIIANNVRMLESVYAVPVDNGDTPATALLLVEDESRPAGSRQTRPHRARAQE
jgi:hypothetical protein